MRKIFAQRARTALLIIIGGAVILGLSQLPWQESVETTVLGEELVGVSGADLSPGIAASAGVVCAAGLLLFLAGPFMQRAALGVSAVGYGLAAWASAAQAVSLSAGIGLPWATAILAAFLSLGCLVALIVAPTWPRKAARYERSVRADSQAGTGERARSDWDALDEGLDPSQSP